MYNDSLTKGFSFDLYPVVNYNCPEGLRMWDLLFVRLFDAFDEGLDYSIWRGRFDVVFDKRTMTDSINTYTSFYPEIDLNGKIFNEVYVDTHNGSYDKSMYYFNLEFGLIGFTDIERQNLYVLDRIE
jgi:hypothetical protein